MDHYVPLSVSAWYFFREYNNIYIYEITKQKQDLSKKCKLSAINSDHYAYC